jgi:endoglucanase
MMNFRAGFLWSVVFSMTVAFVRVCPGETGKTHYRGFTINTLETKTLEDASRKWNVNIVRYMMRPPLRAGMEHCTSKEAWKKMMSELPGRLDLAKRLGILVVLDLHDLPEVAEEKPVTTHNSKTKKMDSFWGAEGNLRIMINCWREIATLCADRREEIWFDLLNEPLDRNDFPEYPRKWPRWAQTLIDEIRKIDRRHAIVIEPGPGGLCWAFKNFPALRGKNLIYSIHQYQPLDYSVQGVYQRDYSDFIRKHARPSFGWPGKYSTTGGDWFDKNLETLDMSGGIRWDKKQIEKELAPVVEFQRRHRVRIYVGEFSVSRWSPNAADYLRENLEIFERYGWDWTYHAFREAHFWSLEHVNSCEKSDISSTPTDRALVMRKYLERNRRNHGDN